jgi:hypothetical protein
MTTTESSANWSDWAIATDEQRVHFKTPLGHRAWSRICGSCGEGDFLQRKHKPMNESSGLIGSGFPSLPEPVVEGRKALRFRTPASRVHVCGAHAARR